MVQRAGIAQINPMVGDIAANLAKMKHFVSLARTAAVDLLIFPELSVVGYPPMDILEQEGFVAAALRAVEELAQCDPAMGVIVGFVQKNPQQPGMPLLNCPDSSTMAGLSLPRRRHCCPPMTYLMKPAIFSLPLA